ncbi:MAG: hypothetical protein ABWZ26_07755 [Candidatus Nanopelagicales bacterium]
MPVPLLIAVAIIGLIATTALVFALLEFFESEPEPTTAESVQTFRDSAIPVDVPTIVTEEDLREFGRTYPPVYWAGPRDDVQYELTATRTGDFYVRYLPEDAEVGDDTSEYLTVATYSVVDGYQLLADSATTAGATGVEAESGALVVTHANDDKRAYFAFEGSDFQVEVFDPVAGVAAGLVADGSLVLLQ